MDVICTGRVLEVPETHVHIYKHRRLMSITKRPHHSCAVEIADADTGMLTTPLALMSELELHPGGTLKLTCSSKVNLNKQQLKPHAVIASALLTQNW